MREDIHSWTLEDIRLLDWQFLQRIPNVVRVELNPEHISERNAALPVGVVWYVQGRVAWGTPLFYN